VSGDKDSIDKEIIEILKRSSKQVGHLYPILVDSDGNIISGFHRAKADKGWPVKKIDVKDELEREMLRVHSNVQRNVSFEELRESIIRLARILESRGVKREKICSVLSKMLPYSSRWIRMLLPSEYKRQYSKSEVASELGVGGVEQFLGEQSKVDIVGKITKPRKIVVYVYFDKEKDFKEFQKILGIKGYEVEGAWILKKMRK